MGLPVGLLAGHGRQNDRGEKMARNDEHNLPAGQHGSAARLDKILASQGLATRREAHRLIRAGRVTVEGAVCRDPAGKVPPGVAVTLDGRLLAIKPHLYIMMNKPAGILCVSRDPHALTVTGLLPPELRRRGLFPAGRLDKDTVGLVLITDDGDYAHRLLSPRAGVAKQYRAILDGPVGQELVDSFAAGTSLEDGTPCLPAKCRILQEGPRPLVEVVITEGKYHQIKRMFASHGRKVLWLARLSIGGLALDPALEEGACRELTEAEKAAVFAG